MLQPYLKKIFSVSFRTLGGLIFTIILVYLFLYHKERYRNFLLRYVPGATDIERVKVLESVSHVSQHYLVGRAFAIVGLFILYTIVLLIIGINNALLLAGV